MREGRGLEEHSFPLFQQRKAGWLPSLGFPSCLGVAGLLTKPTLAGPLPRGFVTWRLSWFSSWGLEFLGSKVGCGANTSVSHVCLGFLPPGYLGAYI